jgi:hypothetical protein
MSDAKFFKLAKAGNLEDLLEAITGGDNEGADDEGYDDEEGGSNQIDEAAYKWLHVAADFGSEEARERADDMRETSSLRYDDGGMVVGLLHLELGQAYLKGQAPLPRDVEKARYHLEQARDADITKTTDVGKDFPAFRGKLNAEAAEVFAEYFPATKKSAPKKKRAAKTTKPKKKKRRA